MPDIHIERSHTLGLPAARETARNWLQQAERDYGMECAYTEGDTVDVAQFTRAGIDGSVEVSAEHFKLHATLGFLYGSFSGQIEQRLQENLDAMLGARDPEDGAYNDKDWA
ncbi:MAG: polyhydroxyalkanoic acid system family protein [Gammaproteobacteria bacterium]|nr:polyhydroxyalkanoic acid system family protein [Gammaproteobacteria bacterium]MBU1443035.1 polyhydroxyalkanoic acid system family protein [Gammaproteobacteria bacterium]MBU2288999.1 polyhydroxyalkanoic acid system family protein [Gammaproteobacteria bacterium]MBU2410464.1 polyhydroxyalkanoic acid system family protein [Gammaproteobacteria bacterium]